MALPVYLGTTPHARSFEAGNAGYPAAARKIVSRLLAFGVSRCEAADIPLTTIDARTLAEPQTCAGDAWAQPIDFAGDPQATA